jgi:hypothetical protein
MPTTEDPTVRTRIERIRRLAGNDQGAVDLVNFNEAASLAQTVIYDTVGGSHPLMADIKRAIDSQDWMRIVGVCRSTLLLYDQGALRSPRLTIAREIEADFLEIAQAQTEIAEKSKNDTQKQLHLGIAAFLAGATLEDALRRLCDENTLPYDPQRSSISKYQLCLYQPSKQIELISQSENKQITVWGDTRNKADHGKFDEITQTEVVTMIMGIRSFIDKHLP